jgi:hypothetical protein
MSGTIFPLPQYVFMAWCLVKAWGRLYLMPLPFSFHFPYTYNYVEKILAQYKHTSFRAKEICSRIHSVCG